ncbi:sensor histidine kinase [Beijerinckiaceae bacterium]|nr:sensor histidine kinase [Beijerinckiaceae bacterium]
MRTSELFKTSTFRLALFFALAVTVSAVVVFIFIYEQVGSYNVSRLDYLLEQEVARAVTQPEERIKRELELRFTADLRHLDYAALFDKTGELRYGNLASIPKDLPIDGMAHTLHVPTMRAPDTGAETAVFVAGRRPDGSIVLLGRSLYLVNAFKRAVVEALIIGLLPAILLALVTGAIFSFRSTRRLKAINETIVRIMHGDLQERLPANGKMDDLNYVTSAVNLMLDEIVRLVGQIKSVGDNIAHDLRAPLAVMHAKLERGLKSQTDHDLRVTVEHALTDLDHALTTVTALLRISEIEFGRRQIGFSEVDLSEVCLSVFELYQPLAEAKQIEFTLNAPAPLSIEGDFDLLVEAIANLVDNAIKFTPRGGSVAITAKTIGDGFIARVSDSGPGVAPEEREHIFKRFYRSDKYRHIPGTGLGLSMAATIADVHGFELCIDGTQLGATFQISGRLAKEIAAPSLDKTPTIDQQKRDGRDEAKG